MVKAGSQRNTENRNVISDLQDFARDSQNFFNKCAKPDRNGMRDIDC